MPQTYYLGARSRFVTVIAWVFMALAVWACALGVVGQAGGVSAGGESLAGRDLPGLTGWLLAWLPWVPWVHRAGLVLAVALLAASVGLLLRREWARRGVIGMLVLCIVVTLAGLWLQHELVQSLVDATLRRAPLPASTAEVVGGLVTGTRLAGLLATLGLCAVCGWIIRRLSTPVVLQEFTA